MQLTLLTTLLLSGLALANPTPKKDQGFQVVIHYVDAPNCDVACGANTTSSIFSSTTTTSEVPTTTTLTSTSTKYVIVTLQTGYGSTQTLGYETATTLPTTSGTESSKTFALPTY